MNNINIELKCTINLYHKLMIVFITLIVVLKSPCNAQGLSHNWQPDPYTVMQKILSEKKIKAILIVPTVFSYADNSDKKEDGKGVVNEQIPPKDLVIQAAPNLISVRIYDPEKISKFAELFLSDVEVIFEPPNIIPRPTDRNTVVIIVNDKDSLFEISLFKSQKEWLFMVRWPKPKGEDGDFTMFMKCGANIGKWIESECFGKTSE